jgi:signal peptidase II
VTAPRSEDVSRPSAAAAEEVPSRDLPPTDIPAPAVRARPLAVAMLAAAAAFSVTVDVITKHLALAQLEGADPVRLLGGAVYLNLTRNSGAAFSIGGDFTIVFPIIAMIVVGAIIWLARRLRSVPWGVAMGLVLGGAMGNLIDRIFRAPGPLRGHVVDFISLFDEAGRVWPIFNVADSSLFCGVALVLLLEFTGRGRDGTRPRKS